MKKRSFNLLCVFGSFSRTLAVNSVLKLTTVTENKCCQSLCERKEKLTTFSDNIGCKDGVLENTEVKFTTFIDNKRCPSLFLQTEGNCIPSKHRLQRQEAEGRVTINRDRGT